MTKRKSHKTYSETRKIIKDSYLELKASGKSVKDISKTYKICPDTVYSAIYELAEQIAEKEKSDANTVYRSLLYSPAKSHKGTPHKSNSSAVNYDVNALIEKFDNVLHEIDNIKETIHKLLQEDNNYDE